LEGLGLEEDDGDCSPTVRQSSGSGILPRSRNALANSLVLQRRSTQRASMIQSRAGLTKTVFIGGESDGEEEEDSSSNEEEKGVVVGRTQHRGGGDFRSHFEEESPPPPPFPSTTRRSSQGPSRRPSLSSPRVFCPTKSTSTELSPPRRPSATMSSKCPSSSSLNPPPQQKKSHSTKSPPNSPTTASSSRRKRPPSIDTTQLNRGDRDQQESPPLSPGRFLLSGRFSPPASPVRAGAAARPSPPRSPHSPGKNISSSCREESPLRTSNSPKQHQELLGKERRSTIARQVGLGIFWYCWLVGWGVGRGWERLLWRGLEEGVCQFGYRFVWNVDFGI
jgi:hypothetical protein